MTLNERIDQEQSKFNDTDNSIIEYIQKKRIEIQHTPIQKVAEDLFISPNAIMRVAKKLGYSGFSELKFSLQIEMEGEAKNINTVGNRVLDSVPENIIKTIDVIDDSVMQKMLSTMASTNNILFAGIGDSVYFCEVFGRYLRCLNKHVEYYQQIHDTEYASKHYQKGDLIVIISASGEPKRLVDLAKEAKRKGTTVFCITHFGKNPLSELCDEQLCFWGTRKVINGYNVTDRSGLMLLIRMICEQYFSSFC